jgi:Pycsar effector protein
MSSSASTATEIDFAKSILEHSDQLIALVDTKAGILLAADGAILAVIGVSSPSIPNSYASGFFALIVVLFAMSAFMGAMTIRARRVPGTPATRVFFGSILEKSREEYVKSFPTSEQEILDDYLNNIYTLAMIQKKKFAYLNRALYLLLAGLASLLAFIVALRVGG